MDTLNKFMNAMESEVGFVISVVVVTLALFAIAFVAERNIKTGISKTYKLTIIALLSALASILMLWEIPLPFAPDFYKIDFSEVPVLLSGFILGPVASVITEFIKILLKLLIVKPTSTAFVGEFANFIIGCAFVIPSTLIYWKIKARKGSIIGMSVGTFTMTFMGCFMNAFILLPAYAYLFGGIPVDVLIDMGTKVNPAIKDMLTFVILAVTPVNIVKGVITSVIVSIIYVPIVKTINKTLNKN